MKDWLKLISVVIVAVLPFSGAIWCAVKWWGFLDSAIPAGEWHKVGLIGSFLISLFFLGGAALGISIFMGFLIAFCLAKIFFD